MALFASIMTATAPQALAIDYGSPDLNYQPSAEFVGDGSNSFGTSDNTDKDSADEEQEDSTTGATTGEDKGSEDSSNDKEDSSGLGYEAFQDCLAEAASLQRNKKCKISLIPATVDKITANKVLMKAQTEMTKAIQV